MQALARHFDWPEWNPPPAPPSKISTPILLDENTDWTTLVLSVFDPARESRHLKSEIAQSQAPYATTFNHLRQTYSLRREFSAFTLQGETELLAQASSLGFCTEA